jgi:hypothetical protein
MHMDHVRAAHGDRAAHPAFRGPRPDGGNPETKVRDDRFRFAQQGIVEDDLIDGDPGGLEQPLLGLDDTVFAALVPIQRVDLKDASNLGGDGP